MKTIILIIVSLLGWILFCGVVSGEEHFEPTRQIYDIEPIQNNQVNIGGIVK